MKLLSARETLFLFLPVVLLGGVAFWKSRVDNSPYFTPPENLSLGKARVVVGKWQALEPTPLDVYGGYTQKWEVPVWIAGTVAPPPPNLNPKIEKTYRAFSTNYPIPNLAFRVGEQWRELPFEISDGAVDMGFADHAKNLRDRMVFRLRVKFDKVPPNAEEIALRGRFGGKIQDRQMFRVAGVPTDTIAAEQNVRSDWFSRRVVRPKTPQVSRRSPIRLSRQMWNSNNYGTSNEVIFVYLGFAATNPSEELGQDSQIQVLKAQILDAKGNTLLTSTSSSTPGTLQENGLASRALDIRFEGAAQTLARAPKPFHFHGLISLNETWPLEVKIQLGKQGEVGKPRVSRFR